MKKWLNKEYVVKRRMWVVLLESLISSALITILLYLCVTEYNSGIVEMLNDISEKGMGCTFTVIIVPVILLIVTTFKLLVYVVGSETPNNKSKSKKKK